MERENSNFGQRLADLTALNASLQSEMETFSAIKERLFDLEAAANVNTDLRMAELGEQIETLTNMNKDLKDQNDELNLQLAAAKAHSSDMRWVEKNVLFSDRFRAPEKNASDVVVK